VLWQSIAEVEREWEDGTKSYSGQFSGRVGEGICKSGILSSGWRLRVEAWCCSGIWCAFDPGCCLTVNPVSDCRIYLK
jgi:hypothetical protein